MDARIAQAGSSSGAGSSAASRVVKVVKPSANETVTLELGYNQSTKLDLSGVANEKLKFVHVGEKLIILFDNGANVTVHPFFDSMGQPLQNLSVEVAPGQNLPSAQFASTFPINEGSATTQVVKVVKPGDEQAVTIELGYDQKVKLDLTAVANEKLTLVHIGEKLIILFDNQSTVTVHPFFDSMGVPLSNVSVSVSSGQDLPSGEFVSTVPISTDITLLPTAGPGTAATEKSGAFFTEVPVEPLSLPTPLPLLPPEQLPVIAFTPEEPPVLPGEPIIQQPDLGTDLVPSLVGSASNLTVDEDGFGNAADDTVTARTDETDSTELLTASGTAVVNFGSDVPANLLGSIVLVDTPALDGQLQTHDGQSVVFALEAATGDLVGSAGATEVIRIHLVSAAAGPAAGDVTYTYSTTLSQPLEHAAGAVENAITLTGVTVQVTDSDSRHVAGQLQRHDR